jgi:quinol-cytochrome oxidoreductase complex cytochrome b subunit
MSKESKDKRIPFFPDLLMAEIMVAVLVLAGMFLATVLGYSAPLEELADPYFTKPNAEAPWYFLFLQGLLKITPKFVGAFIIPASIIVILIALPFIDKGPKTIRRRRIALIIVISLFIIWVILTYMGTSAFGIE